MPTPPFFRPPRLVALFAFACLVSLAAAAEPVKLAPYPQRVRTFYQPTDPAVPAGVRTAPAAPPSGGSVVTARASDGAQWLGTTQGVWRHDDRAAPRDRRQYFAGQRYLPDDDVQQLLPDATGGVWVRTRTGVSHLEFRPMTLAQKAAHFERIVNPRHDRYGLLGDSHLAIPGDLSTNQHVDNDNNGLWTSLYAAAECFRYPLQFFPTDGCTHHSRSLSLALCHAKTDQPRRRAVIESPFAGRPQLRLYPRLPHHA